ncbi:TPA: hypothetical protein ACYESC_003292 [Klebsiella pneumoniae]
MTTDITELAQRMKAAAVRAKTATEEYASGHMPVSVCFAECEEFNRLTDGPDNIIALVEALEKAQQERDNWRTTFDNERFRADKLKAHIDEMTEERNASINELSRIIQKEVKAKRETEQRIAELESRTVTVKLPNQTEFDDPLSAYEAIEKCKDALAAAGIKVEVE